MDSMAETGLSLAELTRPEFGMVEREMVPVVWPLVAPILRDKGRKWLEIVSEAEVFEWLVGGRADLWLGMHDQHLDGFVIGHWECYSHRKRYLILYIAGANLDKYIQQGLTKLEQYCCIMGGEALVLEGRRGWVKWLARYGYRQETVRLKKSTQVLWRN
jgi:hypothetical protein